MKLSERPFYGSTSFSYYILFVRDGHHIVSFLSTNNVNASHILSWRLCW